MNKWLFLFIVFLALFSACSTDKVSGNDAGNAEKISGIITYPNGKPAVYAFVVLRSQNYVKRNGTVLSKSAVSDRFLDTATTDKEGYFEFTVSEPGNYVVEVIVNSLNAARAAFEKLEDEPADLGTIVLSATGTISGRVLLPEGGIGASLVQVKGTDRLIYTGSATGSFKISTLPAGTYTLIASGLSPQRDPVRTNVHLEPGETVSGVILILGDPISLSNGGITGTVRLPAGDSGTFDVAVTGKDFMISVDSATGGFEIRDVPPATYMIQAWGVTPPRDTVEIRVTVASGTVTQDIVLNLGSPLPGSISGTVLLPYGKDGTVIVEVAGTDIRVFPDASGAFEIPDLSPGTYTLKAWGLTPVRDTVALDAIAVVSNEQTDNIVLKLKLNALIIDGVNHHDWPRITSHYQSILEGSGLFSVRVSTSPPLGSTAEDWDSWDPDFTGCDVVVFNFDNQNADSSELRWPAHLEKEFESYMDGGGLVLPHSSADAFRDEWPEFSRMRGTGAKNRQQPDAVALTVDADENIIPVPAADADAYILNGTGGSLIRVLGNQHPITQGLPMAWLHTDDEMHTWLVGPAENMTVLSYAVFDSSGTGHPMEWTVEYGRGRVYFSNYGHITSGGPDTPHQCAGFQTTFIRGAEWAATGRVTWELPDNFPTETETSLIDNLN